MRVSPLVDVNANPKYCPEWSDSEHAVGKVKRWMNSLVKRRVPAKNNVPAIDCLSSLHVLYSLPQSTVTYRDLSIFQFEMQDTKTFLTFLDEYLNRCVPN